MAIVAGICDGLRLGDNAKAALLTRGVAEMTRLGVAMGAQPLTFADWRGWAILWRRAPAGRVATATSASNWRRASRSMQFSSLWKTWPRGVPTTRAAVRLAGQLEVELPITEMLHEVLFGSMTVAQATAELLERAPRDELDDMRFSSQSSQ